MLEYISKQVDDKTVQMIRQILDSPDGKALKEELSKMNKTDLQAMLAQKNLQNVDMQALRQTLERCDKKRLIEMMRQFPKKG